LSGVANGRDAALVRLPGGDLMVGWTQFNTAEEDAWVIRLASISTAAYAPDAGVDDQPELFPSPVSSSAKSRGLTMTERQGEVGLLWVDSRWDTACDPTQDSACREELAFSRVDERGLPIDSSEPVQIQPGRRIENRPALAATDEGYVAAWCEAESSKTVVYAAGFDPAGVELGPPIPLTTDAGADGYGSPSVASRGSRALVVWSGNGQRQIVSQIVDGRGRAVGEPVALHEGSQNTSPAVVTTGEGYAVAWSSAIVSHAEILVLLLDASGAPVGEPRRSTWLTGSATQPRIAAAPSGELMLIYRSSRQEGDESCAIASCPYQMYAAPLSASAARTARPLLLDDDPNMASYANVVYDGSGWSAVWQVARNLRQEVHFGQLICY